LSLRMGRHEANARAVAEWLEGHPKVRRVLWPGLASHPQAALARHQMRNFSGLLSFSVKADSLGTARQLAGRLKLVSYAVSLGKTKSLCFFIGTEDILRSSFAIANDAVYRDWAGEGVFRVSVGLESAADIIADFEQALG
jgi:cystathionine beta-lyase/cystathionine gamma-synthase